MKVVLQQFARYPRPGQVKTRLLGELSAAEACAVHGELMQQTARALCAARLGPVELWLDEIAPHAVIDACQAAGVSALREQPAGDLGMRMRHALQDGLGKADAVLLVGSDCPGLDVDYLYAAAGALQQASLVLGPAEDGGFVLIGARSTAAEMFDGVQWGESGVLQQTRAAFRAVGKTWAELPERYDIDHPQDLRRWRGT